MKELKRLWLLPKKEVVCSNVIIDQLVLQWKMKMGPMRFELTTTRLSVERSNAHTQPTPVGEWIPD
jgi:hypothetical protein